MRIDMINEVIRPLDEFIARNTDFLPTAEEKGFLPVKIARENYHTLGLFSEESVLVGVDGGNATILNAPNFSLDFIRVVAAFCMGNARREIKKKEFFCFTKTINSVDSAKFEVEIIGDDLFDEKLVLDSEVNTLDDERYRIEASSVSGIIRRYAELRLALQIINMTKDSLGLVIDGSVKAKTKEELMMIKELLLAAEEKKVVVGFLSKTCRLLTKNASSLNSALMERGPKSTWYYYPVFNIENADFLGDICFVRLHPRSDYVFRLELAKSGRRMEEYILSLAMNSRDPVFYGYPYCLVEADRAARVSNKEAEYLKTVFLSKIKNKDRLKYLLSCTDAHDVLDSIMF